MCPRIYLVEDHAAVRAVLSALIRRDAGLALAGAAASAEEALSAGAYGACDLLLSDVALPGMDGVALAERVRAERPELPVVLMSADDDDAVAARGEAAGARAFLSKAGLARTLAPTVRAVLGRCPGSPRQ